MLAIKSSINRPETSLHPSCHLSAVGGAKEMQPSVLFFHSSNRAKGGRRLRKQCRKRVPFAVSGACDLFFFNAETRNPGKQPMKVHLPEMLIFLGHFVKIPPYVPMDTELL